MRNILRLSAAPALALVLAACGGDAEEADAPAGEAVAAGETAAVKARLALTGEAGAGATEAGAEATAKLANPLLPPRPQHRLQRRQLPPPPRPALPQSPLLRPPPSPPAACATRSHRGRTASAPRWRAWSGAAQARAAGANYSPAMQAASVTWTEAKLERYLTDPTAVVPGTTMPNPGANPAARRAIIDYLKTLWALADRQG